VYAVPRAIAWVFIPISPAASSAVSLALNSATPGTVAAGARAHCGDHVQPSDSVESNGLDQIPVPTLAQPAAGMPAACPKETLAAAVATEQPQQQFLGPDLGFPHPAEAAISTSVEQESDPGKKPMSAPRPGATADLPGHCVTTSIPDAAQDPHAETKDSRVHVRARSAAAAAAPAVWPSDAQLKQTYGSDRRLLVVSDSPILVMLLRRMLSAFTCDTAVHGAEAVGAVRRLCKDRRTFDLVIVDVPLSISGGLEVTIKTSAPRSLVLLLVSLSFFAIL